MFWEEKIDSQIGKFNLYNSSLQLFDFGLIQ